MASQNDRLRFDSFDPETPDFVREILDAEQLEASVGSTPAPSDRDSDNEPDRSKTIEPCPLLRIRDIILGVKYNREDRTCHFFWFRSSTTAPEFRPECREQSILEERHHTHQPLRLRTAPANPSSCLTRLPRLTTARSISDTLTAGRCFRGCQRGLGTSAL